MAEKSFPFESGTGSILTEDQWSRMADTWQDDGVDAGDDRSTDLKVYSSSEPLTLRVNPGRATIAGFYYELDAEATVTFAGNVTSNPRFDLVVIRLDRAANKVSLAVKQGVASPTPTLPTVDRSWASREFPLASFRVAANSTSVLPSDVHDIREFVGKRVLLCTSSTRPTNPGFGQFVLEADTGNVYFYGLDSYGDPGWRSLSYTAPNTYSLPVLGKVSSSTQTINSPTAGTFYAANVGSSSNFADVAFDFGLSIFSSSQSSNAIYFEGSGVASISAGATFITASAVPTQARLINIDTNEIIAEANYPSSTGHKAYLSGIARIDGETGIRLDVGIVSGTSASITIQRARMVATALVSHR